MIKYKEKKKQKPMIKKIKSKYNKGKIKRAQKREYRKAAISKDRSVLTAFDNAKIEWEAPEFIKHEKGIWWKVIAILFSSALIAFGIIFEALTFSLAISAFVLVYVLYERKDPKKIQVTISNIGIKVGHKKYSYSNIKTFWIVYNPPHVKSLFIQTDAGIMSELRIELQKQDPSEIHEFLSKKIPELKGRGESLTDILTRILKI